MKKIILLCSILLCNIILLSNTALADSGLGYFCIDGNSYYNWTLDGTVHYIEDPCPHGCNSDNGICYNKSPDSDIAFAIMFMWFAIALITIYLAMNLEGKVHGILQVLFMILSLYSVWSMIGSAWAWSQLVNVNVFDPILNANTSIWIWVIIFVVFYILLFFLVFFFNLLRNLVKMRKIKKKGDLMADHLGVGK